MFAFSNFIARLPDVQESKLMNILKCVTMILILNNLNVIKYRKSNDVIKQNTFKSISMAAVT